MAWYTATKDTEMVKGGGSFKTLLKTRGQDKQVVSESLQQKCKQKQEILETDLQTDFSMIKAKASYPYMVIQSTEKNKQLYILGFRVLIPLEFIHQLRSSHSPLPRRETKCQK